MGGYHPLAPAHRVVSLLPLLVVPLLLTSVGTPPAAIRRVEPGPVYDGRSGKTKVSVPRAERVPVIDGLLDEPEWGTASVLTGFSQFFPNDGIAAQDSTEVLVWYSGTALHVGVRAYAAPGSVRATLADRDRITQDDNIQLFLGTYNDSRQALVLRYPE
jgi:hypothetical protein